MSVSSISSNISNRALATCGKPINAFAKTGVVKKVCSKFQAKDLKFIGWLGIMSIVLKDGIGCFLYVKQSLNNKKIPEDKRKFVAALDMTNGGLMVLTQLLAFKTVSSDKFQEKVFGKLFSKHFDKPIKKAFQTLVNNKKKYADFTGREFNLSFNAFKKNIQGTFGLLTSLVAATILAKRVVVPFIATPLADKAKKMMNKNDANAQNNTEKKA